MRKVAVIAATLILSIFAGATARADFESDLREVSRILEGLSPVPSNSGGSAREPQYRYTLQELRREIEALGDPSHFLHRAHRENLHPQIPFLNRLRSKAQIYERLITDLEGLGVHGESNSSAMLRLDIAKMILDETSVRDEIAKIEDFLQGPVVGGRIDPQTRMRVSAFELSGDGFLRMMRESRNADNLMEAFDHILREGRDLTYRTSVLISGSLQDLTHDSLGRLSRDYEKLKVERKVYRAKVGLIASLLSAAAGQLVKLSRKRFATLSEAVSELRQLGKGYRYTIQRASRLRIVESGRRRMVRFDGPSAVPSGTVLSFIDSEMHDLIGVRAEGSRGFARGWTLSQTVAEDEKVVIEMFQDAATFTYLHAASIVISNYLTRSKYTRGKFTEWVMAALRHSRDKRSGQAAPESRRSDFLSPLTRFQREILERTLWIEFFGSAELLSSDESKRKCPNLLASTMVDFLDGRITQPLED